MSSIQPSPKIGPVRLAAALFVPRLQALSDQFNLYIPFWFWHRTPYRDFFLSQEPIMIDLHRVDLTVAAEIVRIDVFISHDPARDGNHPSILPLLVKVSSTLRTPDHVTSPFNLRHQLPKPPESFECRFDPTGKVHQGEVFFEWLIVPGYDESPIRSYVDLVVVERPPLGLEKDGL